MKSDIEIAVEKILELQNNYILNIMLNLYV